MVNVPHLRFNASDRSYFAVIKKDVQTLAQGGGFDAHKLGEINIIVAEMVSNLSKYARDGELFVKLIEDADGVGIEIICADYGPGIPDVGRMMTDGMSSSNTLGHGLGSIKRLSDKFQIYSHKGWGTIVLSRVYNKPVKTRKPDKFEARSIVVAKPGEIHSGDAAYIKVTKDYLKVFLGDGLGHGVDAANAVNTAIEAFRQCPDESPKENLRYIHTSVKKTRGLVGTIAIFNFREKHWKICGVGNISNRIFSNTYSKGALAYNGILGHNIPRTMTDHNMPYEPGQMLVMCSDGMKSKWEAARYIGINRFDASIYATALFREFARNTDDMSVLVAKINI